MTLPTSGTISISMINLELGRAANAPFSFNGAEERALAGKSGGGQFRWLISMGSRLL